MVLMGHSRNPNGGIKIAVPGNAGLESGDIKLRFSSFFGFYWLVMFFNWPVKIAIPLFIGTKILFTFPLSHLFFSRTQDICCQWIEAKTCAHPTLFESYFLSCT